MFDVGLGACFAVMVAPAKMLAMAIPGSQATEKLAESWMRDLGFSDARVTRLAAGGGVAVRSTEAVAQVERTASGPVGAQAVQAIRSAGYRHPHVLFYSWTGYTQQAVEFAEAHGVALFTVRGGVPCAQSYAAMALVAARTAPPGRLRFRAADHPREQGPRSGASGAAQSNRSAERQHSPRTANRLRRSPTRDKRRLVSLVARRTLRPGMAERVMLAIMWRITVNLARVVANGMRRMRRSLLIAWQRPTGRRKIIAVITGLLVVGVAGAALDSLMGIADPRERSAISNTLLVLTGAVAGSAMYFLLKNRDWFSPKGERLHPRSEEPDQEARRAGLPE